MLRTKWFLFIVFVLPLTLAQASEQEDGALKSRAAKQSSRDVKLPRRLVEKIEQDYLEFLKTQKITEQRIKRKLLNISVELTEDRHAALYENVRINTPLGGGVIDLSDFVTPVRGAFELKIVPKAEKPEEPVPVRVFFVSRAKTRVIAGEPYGAGCDKYMEITRFFNQKMKNGGFPLYTADQRYVSVLGGTFVLVSFDKDALMVGSVTFEDSRFPEMTCE